MREASNPRTASLKKDNLSMATITPAPRADKLNLSDVKRLLQKTKDTRTGFIALCPAHDDRKQSLSVSTGDDGRVLLFCHSGCSFESVVDALQIEAGQLFPETVNHDTRRNVSRFPGSRPSRPADRPIPEHRAERKNATTGDSAQRSPIVASYTYHDATGADLFWVHRRADKSFSQQNARTGAWSMDGVARVPYRLPRLLARPGERVWIVEGEKDVATLEALDLLATCNAGGAGKWKTIETGIEALTGRDVIVLPDNDAPGRAHAADVLARLEKIAARVVVVELEGLPFKGDVTDWTAGRSPAEARADLEALADAALEAWSPVVNRPDLYGSEQQDLMVAAPEAWRALQAAESYRPTLFWSSGILSRLTVRGSSVRLETVDEKILGRALSRAARWYSGRDGAETDETARVYRTPPKSLVRYLLAEPEAETRLPELRRIANCPTYARTGRGLPRLLTSTGYDRATGVYLHHRGAPALPSPITEAQVLEARATIEAWLIDFPWATGSDRDNAIGLFLLPFVRDLIDAPTPLHLIEATLPGTGKSILADVLLLPGTAGDVATISPPTSEADWSKELTTALLSRRPAVLVDNLHSELSSATLAGAITARTWDNRILGTNQAARVEVKNVWLATGNNPSLSSELASRTVRIRLELEDDRPEERTFSHADLHGYTVANQGALVWAALVLIENWIQSGAPTPAHQFRFPEYAGVIGGILAAAGYRKFLVNVEDFRERSDDERGARIAFVEAWYAWANDPNVHESIRHGRGDVLAGTLWNEVAREIEGLPVYGRDEEGMRRSFGKWLQRQTGVQVRTPDGSLYRIDRSTRRIRSKTVWVLDRIGGGAR